VPSISAASVLAKVHRDRLMQSLDAQYPAYGFKSHKGYGTESHMEALQTHGPCPEHRRSFGPIRQLLEGRTSEEAAAAQEGLGTDLPDASTFDLRPTNNKNNTNNSSNNNNNNNHNNNHNNSNNNTNHTNTNNSNKNNNNNNNNNNNSQQQPQEASTGERGRRSLGAVTPSPTSKRAVGVQEFGASATSDADVGATAGT
ncbi:unnamed protein product, partial [Polarella glacialis]